MFCQINFITQVSCTTPFSQSTQAGDSTVEIIAQEIITLLYKSQFRVLGLG